MLAQNSFHQNAHSRTSTFAVGPIHRDPALEADEEFMSNHLQRIVTHNLDCTPAFSERIVKGELVLRQSFPSRILLRR